MTAPKVDLRTELEKRRDRIADLMAKGEWWGAQTRRELAAEWGVSDERVRQIAAEAHRLVALKPEDREELRTTLASRMRGIADRASRMTHNISGLPDFRSEIEALRELKMLGGIVDEKPVSVEVRNAKQIVVTFDEGEASASATEIPPAPESAPASQRSPDSSRGNQPK